MDQLSEAFNFKLIGEQKLNGFDTYVLKATARPDYRPPNNQCQVLTVAEPFRRRARNLGERPGVQSDIDGRVPLGGAT